MVRKFPDFLSKVSPLGPGEFEGGRYVRISPNSFILVVFPRIRSDGLSRSQRVKEKAGVTRGTILTVDPDVSNKRVVGLRVGFAPISAFVIFLFPSYEILPFYLYTGEGI